MKIQEQGMCRVDKCLRICESASGADLLSLLKDCRCALSYAHEELGSVSRFNGAPNKAFCALEGGKKLFKLRRSGLIQEIKVAKSNSLIRLAPGNPVEAWFAPRIHSM